MCEKVFHIVCVLLVTGLAAWLAIFGSAGSITECHDLLALDARIKGADCKVTGHAELARDVRHGDVFYLAGLVVDFNTTDDRPISNATALDDIEPDRAWLSADDRRRLYDSHPLGSMTRCYYDSDTPRDRVALRGGVDNLGRRVALHAILALAAAIPGLAILAVFLFIVAILLVPLVLRALSACADAGRAAWTRCRARSYLVFGQDTTPTTDMDHADEQGL